MSNSNSSSASGGRLRRQLRLSGLLGRAARAPDGRTPRGPPACATARAAHPRAPRHTAHPRPHRSPSPRPGSPGRSPQIQRRLAARVSRHPRPIDRDHPRPHQPRLITQPEHLTEQLAQRRLVPRHEPRDRRVIGRLHHRDRLERHVLLTRPLDLPRRPHPTRIAIQQQGHHHRRVIRPPAHPIAAIRPIETRPSPSPRPRPARTTRDDPQAANPSRRAASRTTDHDHNQ